MVVNRQAVACLMQRVVVRRAALTYICHWSELCLSADERLYKLMRVLDANPELSQREIARQLGISLGKVNYCLRALIDKGWVKARNFTNSNNKAAYVYLLTPRGIEQKTNLTMQFLRQKVQEYKALRVEIKQMQREAAGPARPRPVNRGLLASRKE